MSVCTSATTHNHMYHVLSAIKALFIPHWVPEITLPRVTLGELKKSNNPFYESRWAVSWSETTRVDKLSCLPCKFSPNWDLRGA